MIRAIRNGWAPLLSCLLVSLTSPRAVADGGAANSDSATPPVDYSLYGTFENIGQHDFRYVIKDRAGLAAAEGPGIFPNDGNLQRDAEFQRLSAEGKLSGAYEDYPPEVSPKLAFYKWVSQKGAQNQGLRLYNIARALEFMGQPMQALKAYHAIVVNFPKSILWQDGAPWYIGVSALDAVNRLLEAHPEWNLALEGAELKVENGFDLKATNDVFAINPGTWAARSAMPAARAPANGVRVVYQRGPVQWVRWSNGEWQILVHGKPFLIRGVSYFPTPVGKSPDYGYKIHSEWMTEDENRNGRPDGPFDSFVDANGNGKRDSNEPVVGDFKLMQQMGVNTVRLYHQATNKALLRSLNENYGIRVMMGDLVGAYTVGSGADWADGTDYSNPEQRQRMRDGVRAMVEEHKNEDYVLLWVLGNENNYGHGNNARKDPQAYYKFINSLAHMIHLLDPSRPVAICNGETGFLDLMARECPDVDILAANAYRGPDGMGESFWASVREVWRKPVLISEFGCPAHNAYQDDADAEKTQAAYLVTNWSDIAAHAAGSKTGNAIGGVLFEWVDEWWKAGAQFEAAMHDTTPQTKGPFYGGSMYEEWLGLTSQGNGEQSPFLRRLRQSYTAFKNGPWKEPMSFGTATENVSAAKERRHED